MKIQICRCYKILFSLTDTWLLWLDLQPRNSTICLLLPIRPCNTGIIITVPTTDHYPTWHCQESLPRSFTGAAVRVSHQDAPGQSEALLLQLDDAHLLLRLLYRLAVQHQRVDEVRLHPRRAPWRHVRRHAGGRHLERHGERTHPGREWRHT